MMEVAVGENGSKNKIRMREKHERWNLTLDGRYASHA